MRISRLAIPALLAFGLTGTEEAPAALSFVSETPAITPVGQQFQVLGRVVNDTGAEIEGFTLTLSVDGKEYTNEYPTRILVPGASADITWRTDFIPVQNGEVDYKVILTGPAAESSEVAGKAYVRTRRWVVEESTGTWCANCPRGIYVLEQLKEKMGDEFIPIALHTGNDPMVVADWQLTLFTTNSSAPYTMINRTRGCDPGELEAEIGKMERRGLRGSIEAATCALEPETKTLTVQTSVMFDADYTAADSDLRIGYFIIENDVHVDSREYSQHNGFAGTGQLPGWDTLPQIVPGRDMWYQHVGRGFSGDVLGVPGSVPSEVEAARVYDFTHSFTLPSDILEVKNCKLVLMLIDARSKNVLNGLELPLDGSYSGLEAIAPEAGQAPVYYNLEGMKMRPGNLAPGIYIEVRDGKARKIMVN